MSSNWFNPQKSFLRLGIVWCFVLGLLTISTIIAVVIIYHSNLTPDYSYLGFNNFISIFKFPLSIAALIIPLVALLAANHRSEQTKEQIKVANSQNIFINYYKHLEEFTKYIEAQNLKEQIDIRYAHSQLFPNTLQGDYSLSDDLIIRLKGFKEKVHQLSKMNPRHKILEDELKQYNNVIDKLYFFIYRTKAEYPKAAKISIYDTHKNTYLFHTVCFLKASTAIVDIIDTFVRFDVNYHSPIAGMNLNRLNLDQIHTKEEHDQFIQNNSKQAQTFEEACQRLEEALKKMLLQNK